MGPGAESSVLLADTTKAICEKHQVVRSSEITNPSYSSLTLVESLTHHEDALPNEFQQDKHGLPDLPHLSEASLAELQRKDPEIRIFIEGLEKGVKPCNLRDLPPTMSLWSKEWNRLELRSGVLYRRRQERGASHYQLALPTT